MQADAVIGPAGEREKFPKWPSLARVGLKVCRAQSRNHFTFESSVLSGTARDAQMLLGLGTLNSVLFKGTTFLPL